ncbi:MAG: thioredoxin domain-containing protein [Deltaproteobacteria bacterium]|nr:thioredoxin domain-containing protein [Deltaproteobacteria bacterium]
MSKGSAIVAIVFAFVCGVLVGNLTGSGVSREQTDVEEVADPTNAVEEGGAIERFRVPVGVGQPSKGPKDALVTMVMFSEFQCPFCGRVEPTIDDLMKEYSGKLRVVWRNNPLPFHKDAEPAAEAALEARAQGGDDKFWKYHKILFENQRELGRENLEKYAGQVGLDLEKFKNALDGHTHKRNIDADKALAARMGARGTPAFFINGRVLSGAQPKIKFKEIIDDEISRAEKLVKSGVAKSSIYATLTKDGLTKAKEAERERKEARREPDPNAVYKVPVGKSYAKGPKDALVTLVVFSDFQCPFSNRVNPTIKQIMDTYGKDVRVVYKHNALPFHKDAPLAAEAAQEAGAQGKFWEMHDKMFENQRTLSQADLEKYAQEIGLNMARFKKALSDHLHKADVEQDGKLAASLGARGTPSFFINGRSLRGAQPFPSFQRVIDEELVKAKQFVAKGTPRSQVYEKIIANGATSPQFVNPPGGAADSDAPSPQRPDADKIYNIPVPQKAPRKGGRVAKVVIQEFSDYQCPFSGRVVPTVKEIEKEYGDKVSIIWRNYPLPFHKNAKLAAEAATEVFVQAGNDKFWRYHDMLFENQKSLERESLEKYAQQLGGINMARFKKALDDHIHAAAIDREMEAVTKAEARIGTPAFFINGKLVSGAQPFSKFKEVIDEALSAGK